jgi:hypothetical protein
VFLNWHIKQASEGKVDYTIFMEFSDHYLIVVTRGDRARIYQANNWAEKITLSQWLERKPGEREWESTELFGRLLASLKNSISLDAETNELFGVHKGGRVTMTLAYPFPEDDIPKDE